MRKRLKFPEVGSWLVFFGTFGRVTVCLLKRPGDVSPAFFGIAIRHLYDPPSPRTGRIIALRRALFAAGPKTRSGRDEFYGIAFEPHAGQGASESTVALWEAWSSFRSYEEKRAERAALEATAMAVLDFVDVTRKHKLVTALGIGESERGQKCESS